MNKYPSITTDFIKSCRKLLQNIVTFINCKRSGLPFNSTWKVSGKAIVISMPWWVSRFHHQTPGKLKIGNNFICTNTPFSNSIGTIQPCVFNYSKPKSEIIIGDNVGISGSTINATKLVKIGNNVLIGSGCLISDTDSHPIHWEDRLSNNDGKIKSSPITIEDNAFIGARSIILKGITIGAGAVIGAGSVVTQNVPPFTIACGNPAKIIKNIE